MQIRLNPSFDMETMVFFIDFFFFNIYSGVQGVFRFPGLLWENKKNSTTFSELAARAADPISTLLLHTGFCWKLCIIMVAYVGLDSGRFWEELSKGSIFFLGNMTSDWTSFRLRTLNTSGQLSVIVFSLVLCLHWHFCEKCSVSALEASQSLMAKDAAHFQGWSCCLPDPDQNPLFI